MKKAFKTFLLFLFFLFTAIGFAACTKELDLTEYVSENRLSYFTAEEEGIALKAYYSLKEYPYAADGKAQNATPILEVFLFEENESGNTFVSFTLNGKEYGGEMNYDSVKKCFTYSESVALSGEKEIVFEVTQGEETIAFTAEDRKTEDVLSYEEILEIVQKQKSGLISSLTEKSRFNGEIYVRFIYDDGAYYYVGITDVNKKTTALLIDAKNGEILAEKEL